MTTIRLTGVKDGFLKFACARLLERHAGWSLAEARAAVDRLLAGETVSLEIADEESDAFFAAAHDIGLDRMEFW